MDSRTQLVLIARSAQIRESLQVLLRAIPQIETIHQAVDGPLAPATEPELEPALVLLDYDLRDDGLRTTLGQVKAVWPHAQSIVFIDDEQDRQRARDAGADVVLLRGIRAARILETIEGLLSTDNRGA